MLVIASAAMNIEQVVTNRCCEIINHSIHLIPQGGKVLIGLTISRVTNNIYL